MLRVFLDRLDDSVAVWDAFCPSKCGFLLCSWISSKSNLVLAGVKLGNLGRFSDSMFAYRQVVVVYQINYLKVYRSFDWYLQI